MLHCPLLAIQNRWVSLSEREGCRGRSAYARARGKGHESVEWLALEQHREGACGDAALEVDGLGVLGLEGERPLRRGQAGIVGPGHVEETGPFLHEAGAGGEGPNHR